MFAGFWLAELSQPDVGTIIGPAGSDPPNARALRLFFYRMTGR